MSPRARDAAGRPVPAGSPLADEPLPGRVLPEQALPPQQALALARELLERDRPFFAHDVLEAVWKTSPQQERELWQGLAQVCVGLTHQQRGNVRGAARLLRRGAGRLGCYGGPDHGVDVAAVVDSALRQAEALEAGQPGPGVRP